MKDNTNLLDYNQWSATEYGENLDYLYNDNNKITVQPTKEWSEIGENSLKIKNNINKGDWFRIWYNNTLPNKTVTLKITIRTSPNNIGQVMLQELNNWDTINATSVQIPKDTVEDIELSLVASNNHTRFAIYIKNYDVSNSDVFVDNISLTTN